MTGTSSVSSGQHAYTLGVAGLRYCVAYCRWFTADLLCLHLPLQCFCAALPFLLQHQKMTGLMCRCNAQDMLDTSDEDLLQLCRSAVEASEGQAVQGHATQPSQPLQPPPAEDALSAPPAAMPDPDPAPEHAAAASMPAQHLEPAEGAIVVNTQRSRGEGGEPAEMHAGAGGASSGVAVQTQAAAEEAAASASAAQEPSLPAQPPQGKSMLEELLGDAFHLLHAGGSSQPCASEQPGRPDEHVGSGRPPDLAETAAPAHVEAAQHVPELHVPLYEIGSHTSTQRTGLQPAGKKLSLRERMQLMKECD